MIVPVCIFLSFSSGTPFSGGAAIPMSTDIAFSLGVLALLGSRVPFPLKIFLTTLAVVDDIGGILVIAVRYTEHVDSCYLVWAAVVLFILWLGQYSHIKSKIFYLSLGTVVWYLFFNSGVHSTIAGVPVAFCIPSKPVFTSKTYTEQIRKAIGNLKEENDETLTRRSILSNQQQDWLKQVEFASDKEISPLQKLEDSLHPLVNYLIVPLFAFANAGIFLFDMNPGAIFEGITLTIIVSLVLGKFLGIFCFSWLTVKFRLAPMPEDTTWQMIAGVAFLGGIGFTVSIFIANLAFAGETQSALLDLSKLGIVIGSLISGITGYLTFSKSNTTVHL